MILKVGNGVALNWDNVSAVLTNDRNVERYRYLEPRKDTEVVLQEGDRNYRKNPFEIIIKALGDEYTVFKTSECEEMWTVYNEILQALTGCLRKDAPFCDISDICKHADITNRISQNEYFKLINQID